jgi:hypothetical protein
MSHRIKQRKIGRGRNDSCPCGSGKKYKNCCGANRAGKGGSPSQKRPIQIKTTPESAPKESKRGKRGALALLAMAESFMIDTKMRRIQTIHPRASFVG